jgi:hypothetical protein
VGIRIEHALLGDRHDLAGRVPGRRGHASG